MEDEMKIYAVEVSGEPMAVFAADDDDDAEDFVAGRNDEGRAFRDDLMVLVRRGTDNPLWDGDHELTFREATPDERNRWQESFDTGADSDDDSTDWLCFLVAVDDPTDIELNRSATIRS